MKRLLLSIVCFAAAFSSTAQITSIADGNANNPFIWDCLCFPMPSDEVIINHNVVMNVDWAITNGGSITVSAAGTFIEDANNRAIAIDGSGSAIYNMGTVELTNLTFTNSAEGHNHNMMTLDSGLFVGANSTFMNHSVLTGVDSILTQGMFMNEGPLTAGDILNTGMWTNSGSIYCDSLATTGTFNSTNGSLNCSAFGNSGTFSISGTSFMMVSGNWYNSGDFTLATGRDVRIGNDCLTGDTVLGTATLTNNGLFEVGRDFYNNDEITGTGIFCIANDSWNAGPVNGTLDICDNTGTGYFDFNTGTIGANVTDCISGCSVGIADAEMATFNLYPNPAVNFIQLPAINNASFTITAVNGAVVLQGNVTNTIDVSNLPSGVYVVQVIEKDKISNGRFVKR